MSTSSQSDQAKSLGTALEKKRVHRVFKFCVCIYLDLVYNQLRVHLYESESDLFL